MADRVERLMTELLEITADLAQARTREAVARATIERAARSVDAAAVAAWTTVPERNELELLGATSASFVGPNTVVSLAGDSVVAQAVRSREAVFISSASDYATRFPASFERIGAFLDRELVAFAILPLMAGDACLGALVFAYNRERVFDDAGRTYKLLLARHFALALTRVALAGEERVQREAVELLYELTASLNRLDDINHVYQLALESVCGVSRSDRAAILLFDDRGVMRFHAWLGLSETYRAAVEGHSPWSVDEAYPRPVIVDDALNDPAWKDYRATFQAEGIAALAFVPIVHHRKLIGKFMLYRDRARAFAPRDIQLAATVAVHVAQAMERKHQERELERAFREEREAHLLAEEAARAREEILSVVSHDLRNPLGTILMGAATLLNTDAGGETIRVHTTAERIQRQAERMARLIEDLVDFAGMQAGRLELERRRHAPHNILTTAIDIFGPIARERGLQLETEVVHNLPTVDCDGDRAVQVLSNLVANALKVTPKGGQIAIGAQPRANDIIFYVRDTGPGIEPDELPKLFERHWRGRDSVYRGTNLGLSIARGIVDAHGGRIWAESQLGAGSTFYFSLTPTTS